MNQLQSRPCQGCENTPEEYIELACGHNFCLACLAYSYLNYLNDEDNNEDKEIVYLPCDFCKSPTELDKQSITTLETVLQQILVQQEQEEYENCNQNSEQKQEDNIKENYQISNEKFYQENFGFKQNIENQNFNKHNISNEKNEQSSYEKYKEDKLNFQKQEKNDFEKEIKQQQKQKTDSNYIVSERQKNTNQEIKDNSYTNLQQDKIKKAKQFLQDCIKKIDIQEYNLKYREIQMQKNEIENEQKKFKTQIQRFQQDIYDYIIQKTNQIELNQQLYYKNNLDNINDLGNKIQDKITFYQKTQKILIEDDAPQIINIFEENQNQDWNLRYKFNEFKPFNFNQFQNQTQIINDIVDKLSFQERFEKKDDKKLSNHFQLQMSDKKIDKFENKEFEEFKYESKNFDLKYEKFNMDRKYDLDFKNKDIETFKLRQQQKPEKFEAKIDDKYQKYLSQRNEDYIQSPVQNDSFSQYDIKSPAYLKTFQPKQFENNFEFSNQFKGGNIYKRNEFEIKKYKDNFSQDPNFSSKYSTDFTSKYKNIDNNYNNIKRQY